MNINPYESPQNVDKPRRSATSIGWLEVIVAALFGVCVLWFIKALCYPEA